MKSYLSSLAGALKGACLLAHVDGVLALVFDDPMLANRRSGAIRKHSLYLEQSALVLGLLLGFSFAGHAESRLAFTVLGLGFIVFVGARMMGYLVFSHNPAS